MASSSAQKKLCLRWFPASSLSLLTSLRLHPWVRLNPILSRTFLVLCETTTNPLLILLGTESLHKPCLYSCFDGVCDLRPHGSLRITAVIFLFLFIFPLLSGCCFGLGAIISSPLFLIFLFFILLLLLILRLVF